MFNCFKRTFILITVVIKLYYTWLNSWGRVRTASDTGAQLDTDVPDRPPVTYPSIILNYTQDCIAEGRRHRSFKTVLKKMFLLKDNGVGVVFVGQRLNF